LGDVKVRKFVGIVIIIFSLLLAFTCAICYGDFLLFSNFVFWVISLPIYILGQIVRTSKYEFKMSGGQWVRTYIYFFLILPLLFHLYIFYSTLKEVTFKDEKYIYFEDDYSFLGSLNFGFWIILVFLMGALFLGNPQKKGKLYSLISLTATLTIGFSYFMFSEYRGLHEELGLVSQDWRGNKYTVPYEELEGVYLDAYNTYGRGSDTYWRLTFQPKNQPEIKYAYPNFDEDALESIIDVKEIVIGMGVPFIVRRMDEETFDMFDFLLELEDLDKKRYYDLFQINN